jgi:hypothetical protein
VSFTLITVTGQWERPDGSPSQGTVTARCTGAMTNGVMIIDQVPATGRLDDEGKLVDLAGDPFVLAATDDAGTDPKGEGYEWTLEIDEAPVRSFYAPLSHAAPEATVDLSTLEP